MPTASEAIKAFAEKQTAFNTRHNAGLTDLEGDIKALNDKIIELQNTQGSITPEDQALLDDIQAKSEANVTKVEALAAQTPPVVPPVPPA